MRAVLLVFLNVTFPASVPTVATLCVKPCMTATTEANQILRIVRTTFCQRLDVMYLFNRNVDPIVKALFAERVRLCVLFADTLPLRSVASLSFGLSVVAFVSLVFCSLVLLAVSAFSKAGAAGVSTRFFWFSGHR